MTPLNLFVNSFVNEAVKKQSLAALYDSDINKQCSVIHKEPVSIAPESLAQNKIRGLTKNPKTLYVYPAKHDFEEYLEKAEQLIQSVHGISNQAVFEIKGNKDGIETCFHADEQDLSIIDSAVMNFYPKSHTNIDEGGRLSGDYYIYDFITESPFYKSFTTFLDFIVSPVNIIPQILLNIDSSKKGVYQIIVAPVNNVHSIVKEAIDCEWKGMIDADNKISPSMQANAVNEKVEYKSPDFKSYFMVSIRLILPSDSFLPQIKSFISSYTYGSKQLTMLDNEHYEQKQIVEMINSSATFHTGFLLNSHELTSILHIPYQVVVDKKYNDLFLAAPAGDKPVKSLDYQDINIGSWACGNSSMNIKLPIQREIPHVHIIGNSRMGKSVLLSHLVIEKFKNNEAVFVLDPHGDLAENILKIIPKEKIDDVVLIDFGLSDATPQITIRGNVDLTNPSKVSDDLSESMRDSVSSKEKFFGPRMAYYFTCLYFIYCQLDDLSLADIRKLIAHSGQGKILRGKVKAKIKHPIILEFIDEIEITPYESMIPVVTRLSHLLLDEKSLRLFTLDNNRISFSDIMETGKLCLVNLSVGIIGKQRSSILSGLIDSLINNNILTRASLDYNKRKPCTVIKDEFYLAPTDIDYQITGLAKYGLSVIFAHQYIDQVEGMTREVMATAGTRIVFKIRRKDAEAMSKDFGIEPEEFTSLKKFQAFTKIEDEVVKINTPKPVFNEDDYSSEIIKNCLEKYYVKYAQEQKDGFKDNEKEDEDVKFLEFDQL